MANPEQNNRLNKFFENMPEIDDLLEKVGSTPVPTRWSAERIKVKADKSQEFELFDGKLVFQFMKSNVMSFLRWTSDMPDFLRVNTYINGLHEYLSFFESTFPNLVYDNANIPPNLQSRIIFKGGNNVSTFNLNSLKERSRFMTEFVSRPQFIAGVTIATMPAEPESPFYVNTVFPDEGIPTGLISIGFPNTERGVSAWNERTLGWALSTHMERDSVLDMSAAARDLQSTIWPILETPLVQ